MAGVGIEQGLPRALEHLLDRVLRSESPIHAPRIEALLAHHGEGPRHERLVRSLPEPSVDPFVHRTEVGLRMEDAPSRQEHRFDVMYRTWLSSEERAPLRRILETLRGARVWIVGGAVRDLLSRVPSDDVDLATDMTPEEVMDRFGDRAIPTGIRFGTVTVMASDSPSK